MSSRCGYPISPNITTLYLKVHTNSLREGGCHLPFVSRTQKLRKGSELRCCGTELSPCLLGHRTDVVLGTAFPASHPQPRPLTLQTNMMEDDSTKPSEISCPYENFSTFPTATSFQSFSSDHDRNRSISLRGKAC